MIRVTCVEGRLDGEEVGDFDFPAVPRVGDKVSFGIPARSTVQAVHFHIPRGETKAIVRIALGPASTVD